MGYLTNAEAVSPGWVHDRASKEEPTSLIPRRSQCGEVNMRGFPEAQRHEGPVDSSRAEVRVRGMERA